MVSLVGFLAGDLLSLLDASVLISRLSGCGLFAAAIRWLAVIVGGLAWLWLVRTGRKRATVLAGDTGANAES